MSHFQPGELVDISSNGMEGIAEVVQGAKSPRGRVKILLNFMGRLVSAQVPQEHLRPVESQNLEKDVAGRRTRGRGRWVRGFGPRSAVTA